jgi:exonuclease VII large subunit
MGALLAASGSRVTRKRLDLIAALDRRSAEALRELRRRLAARREAVQSDCERLGPAGTRLLARQSERLQAIGAVIEAKDFRRRGWAMVGDVGGRALTRVAGLPASDRVQLHFADGKAAATIEEIDRGGGL